MRKLNYLKDFIDTDWKDIKTVKNLKGCLLHCIRLMKRNDDFMIAKKWESKIKNMPNIMSKESINVVLLSACNEVGL